ncbi:phosphotransferase family protein [Paenibacillus sp. YYML68]|uniref:phosphotransferase family protein n=1 Tax=Paenibacillus sp. YYML68 TaxID=2909250 RepID=UPI00249269BC|nr:aminoglycoside phosphotransferase family protein [Paenibacillus sp. YYML68]
MDILQIVNHIEVTNYTVLINRHNVAVVRGTYKNGDALIKIFGKREAYEREVECNKLLTAHNLRVPPLIDALQVDSYFIMVQKWLESVPLDQWYPKLTLEQQVHVMNQAGASLSQMQFSISTIELSQSKFWHRFEHNDFSEFSWKQYIYSQYDKWKGRIKFTEIDLQLGLDQMVNDVGIAIEGIDSVERITILHCDFIFRNLLVSTETNNLLAIIDFENALIGDPLYDLAKLTWVDLDPKKDQQQIQALIQGWNKYADTKFDHSIFNTYQALQAIAAISWVDKQEELSESNYAYRNRAIQFISNLLVR